MIVCIGMTWCSGRAALCRGRGPQPPQHPRTAARAGELSSPSPRAIAATAASGNCARGVLGYPDIGAHCDHRDRH